MSKAYNQNTKKSAAYRKRHQTARLPLDFYMDNPEEKQVYEFISKQPIKKQFIVRLVQDFMANSQQTIKQ